jgi:hypothetical protein
MTRLEAYLRAGTGAESQPVLTTFDTSQTTLARPKGFEPPPFALEEQCSVIELRAYVHILVPPTRFERVTPSFVGKCSDPLS